MSLTEAVIKGTLNADGTIMLDQKPNLPAGRVQVIVQSLPELPEGDPFWDMMKSIWASQKARGHVPRTVEEVERQRGELRAQMDCEIDEAIRLQDECRRLRMQTESEANRP